MIARIIFIVSLSLAAMALPARAWSAEIAYVIDRLLVGIHQEQDLNSTITKVVPTGTPLEVLERDGDFARVRAGDGVTGWVDASYIMKEKPSQVVVLELEKERERLEKDLEDAVHLLDRARQQLSEFEARVRDLEAEAALREAELTNSALQGQPDASEALREIQRLAEENTRLKKSLATGETPRATMNAALLPATQATPRQSPTILGIAKWQWITLGVVLLLGIGLGGYLMDYSVRRRHGGFRV
ncbi:MAG: TIGR04211 family SH3 domain-containing protein [Gammaproteobacteria bacterium]|nr:MAG: TIGR04211 family SH3 domain-containing protein [Gammaproteobacteria bacterium]